MSYLFNVNIVKSSLKYMKIEKISKVIDKISNKIYLHLLSLIN